MSLFGCQCALSIRLSHLDNRNGPVSQHSGPQCRFLSGCEVGHCSVRLRAREPDSKFTQSGYFPLIRVREHGKESQ